ncbi:transmembrane protein, putative [Medicago truncatula]|uniref:Transmembrane protein, putative n=1 Tax=Medicago truncatula TaxID=3880 RepID=G7JM09_MEDTR|nr:transmembrane protein, putative [Medicago truncatula]
MYPIIHMDNYFIITIHLLSYVCNYLVKLCLPWGRRQLTWIISYYVFCKFS